MKFDLYTNDMWAVRHAALSKFQQAARKVSSLYTHSISEKLKSGHAVTAHLLYIKLYYVEMLNYLYY